jgi:uncharacterized membrane protein YdjX (TVP38/TMEM64 family)
MRLLIKPGLLLCGLLAAGLLMRTLPGIDHAVFSRDMLRDGLRGRVIFLCIGALVCSVGLPRQAVGFAGGFAYGPVMGTLLTTVANLAGCLADMLWARLVGRDWARRRLLRGPAARLDGFVAGNPFIAILTLRLLPVGSSLMLSLLAGVLDVPVLPFLGATLLGSLPQTVIFVLVGSGVWIGQVARIGLGLALFVASGIGGAMLLQRSAVLVRAGRQP